MSFSFKIFLNLIGALLIFMPLIGETQDWHLVTHEMSRSKDSIGSEYYTIADSEDFIINQKNIENFISTTFNILTSANNVSAIYEELDLLNWVHHKSSFAESPEKYQRKNQFGSWIKDPSNKTCLNIRGLVLQRDASSEVTYADEKRCRITSAHWVDPYTNRDLYSADDIEIDHMVPLKNAYISGAWQWSNPKRCAYANFMGNNFHLLPVFGSENSKKSDRSPDSYIPPSKEYVCQYLINWLKIKTIWKLKLSKKEAIGIGELVKNHHCKTTNFEISNADLLDQRSQTENYPLNCLSAAFH